MAKTKPFAGRPRKLTPGAGRYSQLAIYNKIAEMDFKLLENLKKLAFNSESEKTRLEASTYLFDKLVPDKKVESLQNDKAGFSINLFGGGFVPPTKSPTSSVGGDPRPPQIQSFSLAQKSQENIDSNNGSRPTGAA